MVRIITIGDSITEGSGTYNSYRTQLAMNLYNAGAKFEFVGPRTNYDPRISTSYRKHAGWGGYLSDRLRQPQDVQMAFISSFRASFLMTKRVMLRTSLTSVL